MRKRYWIGAAAVGSVVYALSGPGGERLSERGQNPVELQTAIGPISSTHGLAERALQSLTLPRATSTATIRFQWPSETNGIEYADKRKTLASRADQLGEEECRLLLATFASECTLKSASPSHTDISLYLDVVTKESVIATSAVKRRLDVITIDYSGSEQNRASGWATGRSARRQIYGQISQDCREIRRTYGNCILFDIDVGGQAIDGLSGPHYDVNARARFATITDELVAN